MLPPVQAAVQLATGVGASRPSRMLLILLVMAVVLQAQDEALAKVWQQVLYLGDERVQLHRTQWGPECGAPEHCGRDRGDAWKQARELWHWSRSQATWPESQPSPSWLRDLKSV